MTLEQLDTLFGSIATAHYQIQDYTGLCEIDMIEEKMNVNNGIKYPCLCVVPIQSETGEQVKDRRFHVMIFDVPSKDKSNLVHVWSDTEQILDDVIKTFRRESREYELTEQPILLPFEEQHSDWVAGYRTEVVIRTDFNSNYCDIPSTTFVSPEQKPFALIKDQNGNIIATLHNREIYNVIVASGILDDGESTTQIIDAGI
jgi:hypothetical protein